MKQQRLQNTTEQEPTTLNGNVQLLEKDAEISNEEVLQEESAAVNEKITEEIAEEQNIEEEKTEVENEEKQPEAEAESQQEEQEQQDTPKNDSKESQEEMSYEYEQMLKEEKRDRASRRFFTFLTMLTLSLIVVICYRMGNIGFNSFTAWGVDQIELTSENLQILNNTKLDIFGEAKRNGNGSLLPNSSGSYRFSVKNNSGYNMIYNIKFEDSMSSYINMKYRLKIDNIYIRGSEEEYISAKDLDIENIIVPKGSINIYTLEWRWVDDDATDGLAGSVQNDPNYYFRLQITSNIYDKGA